MSADNSGQKYRRKHDPYNGVEEAEIRPDYIARQELSDAEKSATENADDSINDKPNRFSDRAIDRLNNEERNRFSEYSNSFRNSVTGNRVARGRRGGKESIKVGGKKSLKKRWAPISIIAALLFGGGALFYASQSILGPHLSSLYTEATDLQFTSYNSRNSRIFKYLINGGDQIKISNFSQKYTTFTPYMQRRLKNNGIEVGHLNADGNFVSGQAIFGKSTVLKYGDEIIDANHFQDAFASNANFRESYYEAKRGRVAGFFDDVSMKYYDQKGATRDIFDDYKSTGDTDVDKVEFELDIYLIS